MARYDRQLRFFGSDGQSKLEGVRVAIIGVGGLGSHVVQQLAYLGVKRITVVDNDMVDESNLNRLIGATPRDAQASAQKISVMRQMALGIAPDMHVEVINNAFPSSNSLSAVKESDYVFGCLDNDGPRFVLNEACCAYKKPYIDLASGIHAGRKPVYGGRIFVNYDDQGCLYCYKELSEDEYMEYLDSPQNRALRNDIYGLSRSELEDSGPSVVTINAVVASLGTTEFMALVTGIRDPSRMLTYRGDQGGTVFRKEEILAPDCYYCKHIRGIGDDADFDRYWREERTSTSVIKKSD